MEDQRRVGRAKIKLERRKLLRKSFIGALQFDMAKVINSALAIEEGSGGVDTSASLYRSRS